MQTRFRAILLFFFTLYPSKLASVYVTGRILTVFFSMMGICGRLGWVGGCVGGLGQCARMDYNSYLTHKLGKLMMALKRCW